MPARVKTREKQEGVTGQPPEVVTAAWPAALACTKPLRKGGLVQTGLLALWRGRLKQLGRKKGSPWESAKQVTLLRRPKYFDTVEKLDPGVNFFVLALEHLGAKTFYSCEGHPNGFYVYFGASYQLAKRLHAAGYFSVEVESAGWSLRLNAHRAYTPQEREFTLRHAAQAWLDNLLLPP